MTADAVVIGAGVVGACCAADLAEAGQRVVVVEPNALGGGATAATMGHIMVEDGSEAQFALTAYTRQRWLEAAPHFPEEAEFNRMGTLWVAADEDEMTLVRRKLAYFGTRGVACEALDERGLREAEPQLRPGLAGAFRVTDDAIVYPPVVVKHLLRGITVLRRRAVEVRTGAVRLDTGETLTCGAVVVATGVWARELCPDAPVRPRKGHLAVTDRYPGFLRHEVIELGYLKAAHGSGTESVACNVAPRPNGQLLVGSSRQFDVIDPAIEPRILTWMLRQAISYLPGLSALRVLRTWAGFRAATPDGLPLIGLAPGRAGVWLATGHEGLGISTCFGTGRLVADSILGRTPPFPAEPYHPSRYAH